ncbi:MULTISPECIES: nucleoside hydrolase [Bacillaceae]|uniref:Nucleoside hydrolase n=2 Tax=Bacillaceae TaxID=186817 RepID=A0A9D5DUG4_9BACI|nr:MULTISPECIES: nucleoside hydrolase [Bacillaceae]KQL59009.1 nucleoside hydrolase [Alkalicoccobacillus plakortidis]MBG9785993.1 nucleoside hydrolase [Shouchella lehensis]RQW20302.1 nucleoside hydrolase [Bacillus sp. C1-1]TES48472.1 nucleoside hydrolase [Shouchella lehensis]
MKQKLLLDVDTGIDDALGILLAANDKDTELLGITTVNGNVSLQQATTNTLNVLALIEHSCPVVKGAETPLLRPPHFEKSVHGENGLGGALQDVEPSTLPSPGFAPDFMIEQARRYPGEVTFVMTGPLTNLALAVKKCPDLPQLLQKVVYMGGAAFTYGNITPASEYNMYVDPEAARIVLQAGFPSLTQIGLDVTRQALLTNAHIDSLQTSNVKHFVKTSTAHYIKRYEQRNGVAACALHDPLAVAYAIRPDLCETQLLYTDIETSSRLCDGQTICDLQDRLQEKPNVHIALKVDVDAFISYFLTTIQHHLH